MNPVIGILTCGMKDKQHFVPDSYVTAIRLSGGLPILIPVFPPDWDVTGILSLCDGFLLPGGGDFTPLLFDENPLPGIGETNLELDVFQIHFTEEILKLRKPLLGICRGMQLINLAAGGTIYQDLSLQPGTPFLHTQTSQNRSDVSHQVFIEKESLLHTITGDSLYTNSFHHQSIHLTGENVIACAHTSDGTVEAIELIGHPFAVGVQWHPESMFFHSSAMRKLFSCFVRKALQLARSPQ